MEQNSFNMKWIKEGVKKAGKHWEDSTDLIFCLIAAAIMLVVGGLVRLLEWMF